SRMVRAGADWIKATITGSIAAGTGVHDVQFTPAEMAALVSEAASRQRPVMVHAHGARGAELAARCRARSIEHGVHPDEAAVAQLLQLHDCGEIAVGKRADLVLLDGDDLAVDNLAARIKVLWHNGKRFR